MATSTPPQSLTLPDAELCYRSNGHGSPVLFIQGVGVAGSGWLPQTDDLSSEFACVAFDHRGIGRSRTTAAALSIEQMARDALALMDAVGFPTAHVVGHSMGGVIAQQLALDAPQRVTSLALLCTFSQGAEATRLTPAIVWLGMRSGIGSRAMRRRAFLEMLFPPAYLAGRDLVALSACLQPLFGRDLAEQPPIVMQQLKALGRHDCSGRLPELASIPTLVVAGKHDPIARVEYGRRLAQLIPGSRYVEMADASHGATIQDPSAINRLLREHFRASETPHADAR
ncbi:MAG: alpha/beta fold hydrolase [Chthoniobacter sp.]|uniref:alpha/beta fold hydrolase n=1 Tax=Chthoniobacter sp. TaxID=2510640 RepID=UPI0032A4E32F